MRTIEYGRRVNLPNSERERLERQKRVERNRQERAHHTEYLKVFWERIELIATKELEEFQARKIAKNLAKRNSGLLSAPGKIQVVEGHIKDSD